MLFIAQNELEKALVEAVKNPPSAPDFYRLLLESDLLVMGSAEGREDAQEQFSLAPGSNLRLVTGLKDGSQYLPVFSSQARMQEYVKQETKYLSINGRALLELTLGGPVILNPASQYGRELSPQQVQQLLGGPAPRYEKPIRAGEVGYPMALVQALLPVFAARPDIETAWMIQATFTGREPQPLVGIETAGDWPSLMQAIQAAAEAQVPGLVFDIQRVDRRNPAGLTSALIQATPFYVRGDGAPN
jgi:SseB protein N-terminal domain/SseB protein C-terminal domain